MTKDPRLQLGALLIAKSIITPAQCQQALEEQKRTGKLLGEVLVEQGQCDDEQMIALLSEQAGIEYVRAADMSRAVEYTSVLPARVARAFCCVAVGRQAGKLRIALPDPLSFEAVDDLQCVLGQEIIPLFGARSAITAALRAAYGVGAGSLSVESSCVSEADAASDGPVSFSIMSDIAGDTSEASIIAFVNHLFSQAVAERATDIHLEPGENILMVRYRVDGVLRDIPIPPETAAHRQAIISRIKIMAGLNIAERRMPQDGRISIVLDERRIDVRISVLPTMYGEAVCIRILSPYLFYTFEELGLFPDEQCAVNTMINASHGIIFVTGPTGSGKTTTLYACLRKINDRVKKIITIEDPVEYRLPGVTQIQVAPERGLSFAHGLRSMLRHDPDIMMVGEVRDFETAQITIRLALTGHLVLSTLHTNDAPGAVARLCDMGIEPYLLASSLLGVIAQRLVRLVCTECRKYPVHGQCKQCGDTGYHGRTAIYEILPATELIKKMIADQVSIDQLTAEALRCGMRTLRASGFKKYEQGLTTREEIMRVTE